jgi:hypothetical protein
MSNIETYRIALVGLNWVLAVGAYIAAMLGLMSEQVAIRMMTLMAINMIGLKQ